MPAISQFFSAFASSQRVQLRQNDYVLYNNAINSLTQKKTLINSPALDHFISIAQSQFVTLDRSDNLTGLHELVDCVAVVNKAAEAFQAQKQDNSLPNQQKLKQTTDDISESVKHLKQNKRIGAAMAAVGVALIGMGVLIGLSAVVCAIALAPQLPAAVMVGLTLGVASAGVGLYGINLLSRGSTLFSTSSKLAAPLNAANQFFNRLKTA